MALTWAQRAAMERLARIGANSTDSGVQTAITNNTQTMETAQDYASWLRSSTDLSQHAGMGNLDLLRQAQLGEYLDQTYGAGNWESKYNDAYKAVRGGNLPDTHYSDEALYSIYALRNAGLANEAINPFLGQVEEFGRYAGDAKYEANKARVKAGQMSFIKAIAGMAGSAMLAGGAFNGLFGGSEATGVLGDAVSTAGFGAESTVYNPWGSGATMAGNTTALELAGMAPEMLGMLGATHFPVTGGFVGQTPNQAFGTGPSAMPSEAPSLFDQITDLGQKILGLLPDQLFAGDQEQGINASAEGFRFPETDFDEALFGTRKKFGSEGVVMPGAGFDTFNIGNPGLHVPGHLLIP